MSDLQVFQNSEFGELGVLVLDGKEYFPATFSQDGQGCQSQLIHYSASQ